VHSGAGNTVNTVVNAFVTRLPHIERQAVKKYSVNGMELSPDFAV
jgi:hypothetical protein